MTQKFGIVAIAGSPNAGKSTLLNYLIGTKISIVSPKVQTTRSAIRGVAIKGDAQIMFVDTPGIFKPSRKLEKSIVKNAWSGVYEADFIVFMIDATKPIGENDEIIIGNLKKNNRKSVAVINKIDLVNKSKLLLMIDKLSSYEVFEEIFMISALKGDKVSELSDKLFDMIPEGNWRFSEDDITDAPLRFLAQEMTREQIFNLISKELPYSIAVETDHWENLPNNVTKISQVIYVTKASHKAIIIGKSGHMLKTIGSEARKSIEELIGNKVYLKLFVKVKENWVDNNDLCV